jgi:hypothetical protein
MMDDIVRFVAEVGGYRYGRRAQLKIRLWLSRCDRVDDMQLLSDIVSMM